METTNINSSTEVQDESTPASTSESGSTNKTGEDKTDKAGVVPNAEREVIFHTENPLQFMTCSPTDGMVRITSLPTITSSSGYMGELYINDVVYEIKSSIVGTPPVDLRRPTNEFIWEHTVALIETFPKPITLKIKNNDDANGNNNNNNNVQHDVMKETSNTNATIRDSLETTKEQSTEKNIPSSSKSTSTTINNLKKKKSFIPKTQEQHQEAKMNLFSSITKGIQNLFTDDATSTTSTTSSRTSTTTSTTNNKTVDRDIGDMKSKLDQTKDALNERGDRLNSLSDKTSALKDASQDFASMAKELQKSQGGFFW